MSIGKSVLVTAVFPIPYKPTTLLWGSLPLPSASVLSESLPSAGKPICLLCSLLDLLRGGLYVAVMRKLNVLVTTALIVQK